MEAEQHILQATAFSEDSDQLNINLYSVEHPIRNPTLIYIYIYIKA
jgi:hypothetical protein